MFWEAGSLFLHRSWTGYCVFVVRFQEIQDRVVVAEAVVTTDSAQYRRSSDEYDAELLDFLIRGLLLGQAVVFPVPSSVPASAARGLFQHAVAGSRFPERSVPPRGFRAGLKRWFFG
jgi:hypothetical protein